MADPTDAFIERWQGAGAAERSNAQTFLAELCDLLGVPRPEPAGPDASENAYVFERRLTRIHPDGSQTIVSADLYKRGCFMLETKQGVTPSPPEAAAPVSTVKEQAAHYTARRTGHGRRGTRGWDVAMEKAFNQARRYIRDLPAEEGRPPFLVVADVGYSIGLYSEFTCTGGRYVAFPDPRSHRIYLDDLRNPEVCDRLRRVWTNPHALDPSKHAARVTREIADRLARLAKTFEGAGHDPQAVAEFLMRCIFTMFAEDIGLLPHHSFTELLKSMRGSETGLPAMLEALWADMEHGAEFSVALKAKVLHFNGGLFHDSTCLPLDADQLELLIESAEAEWRDVEPAIFGTLLERALDPRDRHKLGAHYTPRAYVERLVFPTIIDPLREAWDGVKAAAIQLRDSDSQDAIDVVKDFHHTLCSTRVLDPACGSGNFLYVTMEHMKRIEGEVLEALEDLGDPELTFEMAQFKVRPHQFLGLEINPRAVPIAELVLQIGYLQWHFRTSDEAVPDDPVIEDQRSILLQDAVLAYDDKVPLKDKDGNPVTHWDGRTTKPHPVTGKEVPDDTARTAVYEYISPRKATWPEADYVVGNPPFVGMKRMNYTLGRGYTAALREAWRTHKPDALDFVMFWWHHAAELLSGKQLVRFGLITTNSINQTFNRRCIERFLDDPKHPIYIAFAVPNHPWVDSVDGAAVRIAMTVAGAGDESGTLAIPRSEIEKDGGEYLIDFEFAQGAIGSALRIGASPTKAQPLESNSGVSYWGVKFYGDGFILSRDESNEIGRADGRSLAKPFVSGRDLTKRRRGLYVIDCDGLSLPEMQKSHPAAYQKLLNDVKPVRAQNPRAAKRERWWIFGENQPSMRRAVRDLPRKIATTETAKHRVFEFLNETEIAEGTVATIAMADAYFLGILSALIHVKWALAAGGRLGVGNDPRYNKTRCFDTFPFPAAVPGIETEIRSLGERLNAHRKRQQAAHGDLTMTGMYNVLEKLRKEENLTAKDRKIHENGLVSVLKQIHDDLDAAVLSAYGWDDLATDVPLADRLARGDDALEEAILERLVALNHERAEEEKRGLIRWLRPDYQNPDGDSGSVQPDLPGAEKPAKATKKKGEAKKIPWPKALPEQITTVRDVLAAAPDALDAGAIAKRFTRANKARLAEVLDTLVSLGHAEASDAGYSAH